MNIMKKSLTFGLALIMAGSMGACSIGENTNWVAKSGDSTVSAGIYIWQLMNQYYDAQSKLSTPAEDGTPAPEVKNILKESIDGVAVPQMMTDGAKKELNKYIAVEQKFTELGLTLDEATTAGLAQDVEGYWEYISASYEKNGISKESYGKMFENDAKKSAIFQAIYGEGGSEAVPESVLKDKFIKDYAKIMVIPLNFSTSEDPAQKESDNKAANEMIEKYYQQLKAGGNVEDVVFEAKKEVNKDETLEKPEAGTSYTFVSRDNSPYEENVTEAIFAAKNGEPVKVESTESAYLFVRYDIAENEQDFISRKATILKQLKSEEMNTRVDEWAAALTDVTYNDAALKRYTPSKLKMQ